MKRIFTLITILCALGAGAQGVKPLPSLHTEGRWLVDKHGNQVVLHGVMDTPSNYFNGGRWEGSKALGWWDHYNDTGVTNCLAYFEKLFKGMEKAKCDVFRLHMDPAWTNDPADGYVYAGSAGQASDASGEADIKKFNPERYQKYMPQLYLKLAEMAMKYGMYVVVRPPGVCPHDLKVGDYYNQYLMYVWDVFSQQEFVKDHAGQISIELANEPVNLRNAQNQDDPKALHDYFQPIVNKIRENGFTGIIWAPGTGWQANYTSYATYPIEGDNIGYAVHDYTGWYGCSDTNPDPQNKIEQFHKQVPVVDTNPIIITEVDWSPENPSAQGHYNEHNEWVQPNYGTWSTGSTSKWGKAYKAMLDYYGNISMTLSGTGCLFDIDKLLSTGNVYPAFNGLEEACGKACMDWYADYYTVNYPHADDEAETGDFYTIESLKADQESFDLMIGDKTKILLNVLYRDGHTKDISDVATYEVDQPSVVEVKNGSIRALANGEAQVQASYTDVQGTIWKKSFVVKVTGLDLGALTALSSLSDITDLPFAIVNKESQKMFYGPENQNLDMGDPLGVINNKSISGYMFKAEAISGRDGCYLLRLMTLNGSEYSVYGKPGYLNSQPTTGWCSFILGLNNQNGEDVKDGAVWEIKYESGKGFTLKNMATGKYLKDAAPAKYDAPAYFDFLKSSVTAGIHKVERSVDNDAVYTLQGIKIATLQQWDALPRGIYIVGGKKKLK
ncbi:Cellulase (glycosyl hydrolase family 5) [Prevotella sp. khp1]|uniref:cellulase family glycosylhydrolase n=1 Tax=Prevotellaceae TaxID=171552 RepID=UPI000890FC7F|nr:MULTISPECIES: cellulase family glycosylhydrolase [Prevotellaceae]QVJ79573.1 cellulase family glycosylhydrolase [Xylanibacter ruminicola]SDQ33642.1 Cellulase (glycosyl hydrolase family 5) [Prevotella sp. khp1]